MIVFEVVLVIKRSAHVVHVCNEMSLRIGLLYTFLKSRPLKVHGYIIEDRFLLVVSLSNCLRLFLDRVVSLCLLLKNKKIYMFPLILSMTLHLYFIVIAILLLPPYLWTFMYYACGANNLNFSKSFVMRNYQIYPSC